MSTVLSSSRTMVTPVSTQTQLWLIIAYFMMQCLLAPFNLLGADSYYYWAWSRHLALSYYDGPPMIAYLIRLFTVIFGDTLFALNLLALVLTAGTAYLVYQTARLFLHPSASLVACLLWVFSPVVTIVMLLRTTYDTPQLFCWALALYFICRFLQKEQRRDLYFTATSIGLLLLSKYTGIVLPLALMLFVISSRRYRYLLRSIHFYIGCCWVLLLYSPVLIWNYQHGWVSFIYQSTSHEIGSPALGFHNMHADRSVMYRVVHNIVEKLLPVLNVMILPVGVCLYKKYYRHSAIVHFCLILSLVFASLFLYLSAHTYLKPMWLAPFLMSGALLAGFCYEKGYYPRATWLVISIYILVSVIISLTHNPLLYVGIHTKRVNPALIKRFNEDYPHPFKTVLTCSWLEARSLFFLSGHPPVYTLSCPYMKKNLQNQYAEWSRPIQKQVAEKKLKEALYIDFVGHAECARRKFDKCERLNTRTYTHHHKAYELFAYRCTNT